MSTRTYQDAISKLNTLVSNADTLAAMRAAGNPRMADFAIPEMVEYLQRIGYSRDDLNKLNVIHVSGTKGKGSTCAFIDSILRHISPSLKVGLYTSPHLVAVRERIRIDGAPISEADFARFFFDVWDRLESNPERKDPETKYKPMYFRFLTLVAYHAFLTLEVDATVLEVGLGGTYDCTNIVEKPIVTGITSLGLDHVGVLGKTLSEIAWHKTGIFKEGVPAFTVPQPEEAMKVIKARAEELKVSSLTVVPSIPEISSLDLGISGTHQIQNANLAAHLAHGFLGSSLLPLAPGCIQGLRAARWPGRCQQVPDPSRKEMTWFVDGAHTIESLTGCAEWYAAVGTRSGARVLIFNCTNGRSGSVFLGTLLDVLAERLKFETEGYFDHVIFCPNVTYASREPRVVLETDLTNQEQMASSWLQQVPSYPTSHIHVLPTIEDAVGLVRGLGVVDVLVTGSLHLVGGVIEVAGLSNELA